ncbi:MAG TPA: amidase [Solirubrobacteraceae bacterium]|nr:amidase [Solirubrobacteraceae bacterium]
MADELHWRSARALAGAIRDRELSAREVVAAHLGRIERVNPRLNAIVTLDPERALAEADAADARQARGEPLGPLHGLPVAVKDLEDTAGMRTTYGSALFAEHVPAADGLLAARLRAAGAIVVGKTNTPEFGVGSHTFNEVFGATRNPWAPDRSAGGSSGGAGAALAAGLVPLADGSDHGGSIRNPASFNHVVGLRPTPELVPSPSPEPGDVWDPSAVLGPMARTIGDLSLMLSAIAGPDRRAPLSHGDPAAFRHAPEASDPRTLRIGWWPDVGGLPIEPAVAAVLERARERLIAAGATVEEVAPDVSRADEAFETLRALGFARAFGGRLPELRRRSKATLVWNVERGLELDGPAVARAQRARAEIFTRFVELFERFDLIVAPAAQVTPFPIEAEYPRKVAGVRMHHYLEWMRACTRITVCGHPVLAVPAGFTPGGLPVGMQLVGRFRGDRELLAHGAAWEAATGFADRHPAGF